MVEQITLTDDDLDFALSGDESAVFSWFFHDPVAWIETHFFIPETKMPMKLYPAQAEPLREALRQDDDGLFIYSTVLWSAIKKSAKSSIAAAVGLGFAWSTPNAQIKVLGNDLEQAKSRVFEYMTRAIRLNPAWESVCKVKMYEIELPNGSRIKALPIDPEGEAGGNDDLVIYTELWGWIHKKAQRMWTETTLSPTKFGRSMRWCESYAGFEGESVVLEAMYQGAVNDEHCINKEFEMYALARLFVLWMTKPSLPWQTPEYYAQEDASLTPDEFSRVHRNEWNTSSHPFVPYEWWETCAGNVPAHDSVIVALDAAVSDDCFGMVAVSSYTTRNGENELVRNIAVQATHVIEAPANGGKIDYDDAREVLKAWSARWRIVVVVYDETQLHDFATQAQKNMKLKFEVFPQGAQRAIADKNLYDIIREARIVHKSDDQLNAHIKHAARSATMDSKQENKLRIIKKNARLKIDAAVALSMASHAALDPKYRSETSVSIDTF